jgi:hypothetical protein
MYSPIGYLMRREEKAFPYLWHVLDYANNEAWVSKLSRLMRACSD